MRETPLDPNLKYPWQQAVLDAIMEFHPEWLRDKMTAAERAISGGCIKDLPNWRNYLLSETPWSPCK
jgi:hypothetical protein